MLEVKPEGLAADGERLEYIVREQSRLIGSLHDAGKALMRLSGLDEARAMLGKEIQRIEEEQVQSIFMARGLEEIRQEYLKTEQRAADNLEETAFELRRVGTELQSGILDTTISQVLFV